jgi:hypothetical protein
MAKIKIWQRHFRVNEELFFGAPDVIMAYAVGYGEYNESYMIYFFLAVLSAVLFGAATPASKALLGTLSSYQWRAFSTWVRHWPSLRL